MREEIFARKKELGWIPADTELTARPATLAAWTNIPENERGFQLLLMEVFAGYTEHADTHAGHLIDELERLGIRDNTLILYILGDNGASAEGCMAGMLNESTYSTGYRKKYRTWSKTSTDGATRERSPKWPRPATPPLRGPNKLPPTMAGLAIRW